MNTIDIFRNYPLESDSPTLIVNNTEKYSNSHNLHGGKQDIPTGGFPPIYMCTNVNKVDQDKTSDDDNTKDSDKNTLKRGFDVTKGNIVSIQNILEKRRNIAPFIAK
jgi:hypothetical protein